MTWTDDVPYWVQVLLLPKFNNYLLLAIKNFSSKTNLSSHHVMAYLVHEEKKKRHQFYIAVQKMYGWYNWGHNNKVLKELNVTPTSDGYMVFLFWKKCYRPSNNQHAIIIWWKKSFRQRIHNFCYFSLFYTWIIGENISLVSSVFDAVRHLTTLRETDHLRLLKASPNMYTNLQSNVIQHFEQ